MQDIQESGENYLEVILEIEHRNGVVRSVEVARHVGVSRASVSKALNVLREKGLVKPAYYGTIQLTAEGRARAQAVRSRHDLLCQFLQQCLGVDPKIAEQDACRAEHVVSEELMSHVRTWLRGREV